MFEVGEKVVYPIHGVGIIEKIEEREVLQKKQLYYFIKLTYGDMTMMIPVGQSEKLRLRKVDIEKSMSQVIEVLNNPCENIHLDWKIRYNNNQQKLKEGSVVSLAEVVRDLFHRNHIKELSRGEKKLFDNAFQLLSDELSYAENKEAIEVRKSILSILEPQVSVPA